MTQEEKTQIEERIVDVLKTVYDPEIPVDIWNLGMIYKIDVKDDHTVDLDMTFTAPNCPAADFILEDVLTNCYYEKKRVFLVRRPFGLIGYSACPHAGT